MKVFHTGWSLNPVEKPILAKKKTFNGGIGRVFQEAKNEGYDS